MGCFRYVSVNTLHKGGDNDDDDDDDDDDDNCNYKLYYVRYIKTDRTIHNKRPNIAILDKTIKEAYLLYAATANSHSLHSTNTEMLQ
jgi:hypothetical protein